MNQPAQEIALEEQNKALAQTDARHGVLDHAPVVTAPTSLAQTLDPMALISMAVNQNADIDKLEKLIALAERWDKNNAKKEFDRAMSQFKGIDLVISKDAHVSYSTAKGLTDYKHETLSAICKAINGPLSECGLSYVWETTQEGGNITVTCIVSHALGHNTRTMLLSNPDSSGGKNGIQAVGSTVTYLQRYTLRAALGLSVQDESDDDGRGSEGQEVTQDFAVTMAVYPIDLFEKNFPQWEAAVQSKRISTAQIINKANAKGALSADQISLINNIGAAQ
jgi:hypothetical protein